VLADQHNNVVKISSDPAPDRCRSAPMPRTWVSGRREKLAAVVSGEAIRHRLQRPLRASLKGSRPMAAERVEPALQAPPPSRSRAAWEDPGYTIW